MVAVLCLGISAYFSADATHILVTATLWEFDFLESHSEEKLPDLKILLLAIRALITRKR